MFQTSLMSPTVNYFRNYLCALLSVYFFLIKCLTSVFFYDGFDRIFFSNEMLDLLDQIFQQKEEEVFCIDVNMSELTCQGGNC